MKRTVCLLLAVIILSTSLIGCGDSVGNTRTDLNEYIKTLDYHDGFKILQLTDIHWNTGTQIGDESYGSIAFLKKVIDESVSHAGKIDLIEITGDTFMLSNSQTVKSFIEFMESVGIPYAIVWGNHDREGLYNPNWISDQFLNAPHSLYTEVDDDINGRCNYVINLVGEDGNAVWQIANLDSGSTLTYEATDVFMQYDYIHKDQFDWLKAENQAAGENIPVICYYHIPQKENMVVYEAVASGKSSVKSKFFKVEESFAESPYAYDTEEYFKAANVKAAFMGHAHSVDWTFTAESGITYGFGVKTGTELYYGKVNKGYSDAGFEVTEDFDLIGASLVTLNNSKGEFELEHLYLNERDGGDFVLWVNYND